MKRLIEIIVDASFAILYVILISLAKKCGF